MTPFMTATATDGYNNGKCMHKAERAKNVSIWLPDYSVFSCNPNSFYGVIGSRNFKGSSWNVIFNEKNANNSNS